MGRSKQVNHNVFENIDTDEKAYWVGFLMADGCIALAKSGKANIRLDLKFTDKAHVEKYKKFLGSEHKISINKRASPTPNGTFTQSAVLSIRSDKMAADLAKYGVVPKKSLTAKVKGGLELNKHFWRGVIDGDGGIHFRGKYPSVHLAGSKDIIEQFIAFCKNAFPDIVKLNPSKRDPIYQTSLMGAKACQLIKYLYKNASVSLDRKQALAQKALDDEKNICTHEAMKIGEEQVREILLTPNWNAKDLAKKYGISEVHVWAIKRGQKWKTVYDKVKHLMPNEPLRPIRVQKLDETKVREILASNESNKVLIDRYGVTKSTVCAIKRGDMWSKVYAKVQQEKLNVPNINS